jgi:hypothetical protein
MNWLFRKLLNSPGIEAELNLRPAKVAVQYVPIDAVYVTMAQASQADFASLSTWNEVKNSGGVVVGRNQKVPGDGQAGYLFHDGTTLTMTSPEGTIFAIPFADIQAVKEVPLFGSSGSGMYGLAILYNNVGYLVAQFYPIKNDSSLSFNTWQRRQSDRTCGWLTQLRQHGVTG